MGYVPQGRRVWPSLTVDEHLRLVAGRGKGAWTVERIYETFPRLAERRGNGGSQLSGGEQQMLAISRALLLNPRLLVMDEPTEGLAPVIVDQVVDMLKALAREGDIAVLLVEQNLGVALDVADEVSVMVNGRIARTLPSGELAADLDLQQRLLGIRSDGDEDAEPRGAAPSAPPADDAARWCTPCAAPAWSCPSRARRGAAHRARLHALERGRRGRRAARPPDRRRRARRPRLPRPPPLPPRRRTPRRAPRPCRSRAPPTARPTSPAPSTPRAASSSSCKSASSASACAP